MLRNGKQEEGPGKGSNGSNVRHVDFDKSKYKGQECGLIRVTRDMVWGVIWAKVKVWRWMVL